MRVRSFCAFFALLILSLPAVAPLAAQAAPDPAAYETLRWRNIGPEGKPLQRGGGDSRPAVHLLRGRGLGRDLQDDGRRRELGRDVRRPAGAVDRLARRLSDGPQHRLDGDGGREDPQPRLGWTGRLQVDGRGGDLDPHGAGTHGTHPAPRHPSREPGHRLRVRVGPLLRPAAGAGASTAPPTAGRAGNTSSSSTRTRGVRTSRWTRRTHASSSPARGSSRSTPGGARAAVRAVVCTCRATAGTRGRS